MTIEEAMAWVDLCAGIPSQVIAKMSDAEILVKCLGTQDALAAEVRRTQAMRCDGCRYYDDMERAAFTLPFCRKWSSDGPQPNTVFCMDIKGCLAWEKRDD